MMNGCSQSNPTQAHLPQVTDTLQPSACNAIDAQLLSDNVGSLASPELRHQNLPNLQASVSHLRSDRDPIASNVEEQVSCNVPCAHPSFNDANVHVEQLLQDNSSSSLNTCQPHITGTLKDSTTDHSNPISQVNSMEQTCQHQLGLNDPLNLSGPSLPNSNQHIIVNLMNSAASQSEIHSAGDFTSSGILLSQQLDNGIPSVITQSVNSNLQHQNVNIPLLSAASPGLNLGQNFNLTSLPMNLLMPDPMCTQSNSILSSYGGSGCGNYSSFDSSISWLADNRNYYDRNFNNSRLSMLENIGLCSPNSVESLSRNCKELGNYPKCLSSLDPVQSWLNISSINQPGKYSDQISPNNNMLHFESSPDVQKFDLNPKLTDCLKPDVENKSKCVSPKSKLTFSQLAVNTEFADYEYNIPCINNSAPYSMDLSKFTYHFSKNDYPPASGMSEVCAKVKQTLPLYGKNAQLKCSEFDPVKRVADCSLSNRHGFFGEELTRNDCMKVQEGCADLELDGDGSEESDIIVEDSDSRSADEEQNEISVDGVENILNNGEANLSETNSSTITLRCFICDLSTTTMPAAQFIHTNSEFPVTSATKTPIVTKLLEFVPREFHKYIGIENHFLCCRCFNLIETVESLEAKLKSVKRTVNETLARTVTIVNIRDAEDKEIGSLEEVRIEWFRPQSSAENVEAVKNCQAVKSSSDLVDEKGQEACADSDVQNAQEENKEVVELLSSKSEENPVSIVGRDRIGLELKDHQFISEDSGAKVANTVLDKYFCSDCGKGFKSKSKLSQHFMIHSGKFHFLCELCGKPFRQKHHLKDHILKHAGKFKHSCKICHKRFVQKSTLRIHATMHSQQDGQMCQHCGKKFSNKWNLTAHINLCLKVFRFACEFCEKKFSEKRRLENHVQSAHENNYKFSCEVCKKGFMKKSSLDAHMLAHSNVKAFVCQKCGKSYKTLSNLNQHSKVHSVSTQFNCTFCDAKFLRKSSLEAHLNNHKGTKPFKCAQCEKIFASEHYLKIHRKQHERKKNELSKLHDSSEEQAAGISSETVQQKTYP